MKIYARFDDIIAKQGIQSQWNKLSIDFVYSLIIFKVEILAYYQGEDCKDMKLIQFKIIFNNSYEFRATKSAKF